MQRIILWGKFRSLNKRYDTHLKQAKKDGHDPASRQHIEENFWYETALLLEQRRRLQFPKTARDSHSQALPLPRDYPKTLVTTHAQPEGRYLFSQNPPSAVFILIFSLLSSIAMGTGLLWLVAPELKY